MAKLDNAVLEAARPGRHASRENLVAALPTSVTSDGDDDIVAGYGRCYACDREGKNPLTGGKPCGGFINDNKGYSNCKTCGHNYTQHA